MAGEISYALSDGLHIAYSVEGQGPPDLVMCEPTHASFEHLGDFPPWARFVERLAGFGRVIKFDRRGTGLSDRPSRQGAMGLEARVDDLRAVLDAVGSDRSAVMGIAAGSWAGALFAASHPERTSALILYWPRVCNMWSVDHPWGWTFEGLAEHEQLVRRSWGQREWAAWDLGGSAPSLAASDMLDRWAAMARRSSTPGEELQRVRLEAEIDIRAVLPAIRVPTLVMTREDEPEESRYVASRIPGAELVELEGADMAPWAGDTDAVCDTIRRFLGQLDTDIEPDRVLVTALFTDIVASTEHATMLGDRAWREVIDGHDAIIRGQLARFRGREVDTAGDGFLAVFDGPARALRCACRIVETVRSLGIEVRAGLHTGECEQVGDRLIGVAIHTAARVAAQAGPSEVLVSSTVKELVAGSPFQFTDRGVRSLKGVGNWHLYGANED
jgi:class 3 adenylate cyclase